MSINPPKILFEDPHLVVLDKPAGLLSQGEHTGDENLVDWLRGHFGRHYVGLVHRLDRNTSGLMVVAKRTKSAQRLTEALLQNRIRREYLAWLRGRLSGTARWEHRLEKDIERNLVRVTNSGGQPSALRVTPIEVIRNPLDPSTELTLARFCLETGRSHQIRVQAAAEKHPLLGDVKYGPRLPSPITRPALHSARLEFPHPISGKVMVYELDLPADMASVRRTVR